MFQSPLNLASALIYDHRIVDGSYVASFLARLKEPI
ncbi:hypothetical protein BH23ACT11_BH23ACT11_27750 [soil metagenome]